MTDSTEPITVTSQEEIQGRPRWREMLDPSHYALNDHGGVAATPDDERDFGAEGGG